MSNSRILKKIEIAKATDHWCHLEAIQSSPPKVFCPPLLILECYPPESLLHKHTNSRALEEEKSLRVKILVAIKLYLLRESIQLQVSLQLKLLSGQLKFITELVTLQSLDCPWTRGKISIPYIPVPQLYWYS